jgi:hypothetical protein
MGISAFPLHDGGCLVENPFTYGVIVTGKCFTDREEELAELKLDMRSGQNVVSWANEPYSQPPECRFMLLRVFVNPEWALAHI